MAFHQAKIRKPARSGFISNKNHENLKEEFRKYVFKYERLKEENKIIKEQNKALKKFVKRFLPLIVNKA